VFFPNSGSESVDTALKIARGYHRARGEASRIRFISRAKAYHGMGWGGLSVSGIVRHRRDFGPLLPEVDHPAAYARSQACDILVRAAARWRASRRRTDEAAADP
jgi:adenosylmethionine-8-amino-7-oxononanoate aminotransferase